MSPPTGNELPADDLGGIKGGDLFRGVDDEALAALLTQAERRRYHQGDAIVGPAEEDGHAQVIARGAVRLDQGPVGDDPVTVAELGPGDIYGFVPGAPDIAFTARMTAVADGTVVYRVPVRALAAFVDSHADLLRAAAAAEGRRAAAAYDRMTSLATEPVAVRLARHVCALAERDPERRVSETQAALAASVGCSREEVTRILGAWTRRGLIERTSHQRGFSLPDPERLLRECSPKRR